VIGLPAGHRARVYAERVGKLPNRETSVVAGDSDATAERRLFAICDILCHGSTVASYTMTRRSQVVPTTERPHFATLLVMALAPEEIGERIATRRKELGWTHRQLADKMNVGSERTVQRWQKGRDPKTGKSWLPRLMTLMELADVMEVDRSYFIENAGVDRLARVEALTEEALTRIQGIEQLLRSAASTRARAEGD
jgi:transcriptional regulator with XRE-family HTH domain